MGSERGDLPRSPLPIRHTHQQQRQVLLHGSHPSQTLLFLLIFSLFFFFFKLELSRLHPLTINSITALQALLRKDGAALSLHPQGIQTLSFPLAHADPKVWNHMHNINQIISLCFYTGLSQSPAQTPRLTPQLSSSLCHFHQGWPKPTTLAEGGTRSAASPAPCATHTPCVLPLES